MNTYGWVLTDHTYQYSSGAGSSAEKALLQHLHVKRRPARPTSTRTSEVSYL